ncbi:HD domain-containing protein, partial [Myxococcota bacterium]|nr:HD domain-containing protein [Myxococcota bacterium]
MTHLSTRFEEALTWAHRLHQGQRRKQGGAPYIAHLLSVAALILEHGGDEDAAIAGLLHDAAEDQGGVAVLDEARRRFGDRVAEDIAACSDTLIQPKPLWRAC